MPDTKNLQIRVIPRRLSVRFDSVLLFLLKLLGPLIKLLQQLISFARAKAIYELHTNGQHKYLRRLLVVPFSSGTVERAKRERA